MYLLISDMHLGSPMFELKEQLIKVLTDEKYSRIYIIGDLLDEWETDIDEIKEEFADVIDCINNSPKFVTIIRGNHDPESSVLKSIFPNKPVYSHYITDFRGRSVIMFHGDEFDFKITEHMTLSKFLFPIQWTFERAGFNLNKFLRNLYHSIAQKIGHKNYNDLVMDVEQEAAAKYAEYDIFVMGHTHKEKLVKLNNNRFYINTGSLINYPVYVEFDEEEEIFKIRKFEGVNYEKYVV